MSVAAAKIQLLLGGYATSTTRPQFTSAASGIVGVTNLKGIPRLHRHIVVGVEKYGGAYVLIPDPLARCPGGVCTEDDVVAIWVVVEKTATILVHANEKATRSQKVRLISRLDTLEDMRAVSKRILLGNCSDWYPTRERKTLEVLTLERNGSSLWRGEVSRRDASIRVKPRSATIPDLIPSVRRRVSQTARMEKSGKIEVYLPEKRTSTERNNSKGNDTRRRKKRNGHRSKQSRKRRKKHGGRGCQPIREFYRTRRKESGRLVREFLDSN